MMKKRLKQRIARLEAHLKAIQSAHLAMALAHGGDERQDQEAQARLLTTLLNIPQILEATP